MAATLLNLLAGTLPPNVCYSSEQERLLAYAAHLQAILPSGAVFYNRGPNKPPVDLQSFDWFRSTDARWYQFSGIWFSPNPTLPGWHKWEEFATEAAVWAYDGGDGTDPALNPPTDNSGAMWEVDHTYDGRSPMGPGAISGSTPPKTLNPLEQYGVGTHVLTIAQLAKHYHQLRVDMDSDIGGGGCSSGFNVMVGTAENDGTLNVVDQITCENTLAAAQTGSDEAHPNVHPVKGMFCIRRTNRKNYTVP